MYQDNANKIVIVVNRQLEPGRLANAMAHAIAGLVDRLQKTDPICFLNYPSQAGWSANIAQAPVIVLRADNGNQLRRLHNEASASGVASNAFVHTMLGASAAEQQAATAACDPPLLEFWAVALHASAAALAPLTKRFSVYN